MAKFTLDPVKLILGALVSGFGIIHRAGIELIREERWPRSNPDEISGIGKFSLVDILMASTLLYAAYRWVSKEVRKYNPSAPAAFGPELPGIGYSQQSYY